MDIQLGVWVDQLGYQLQKSLTAFTLLMGSAYSSDGHVFFFFFFALGPQLGAS